MGKALYSLSIQEKSTIRVLSMYDCQEDANDNPYFPSDIFKAFAQKRIQFIWQAVWMGRKKNQIVLSHINLLLVGWLIKIINPSANIILIAHGIEVWGKLSWFQKLILQSVDLFIPVSQYTAEKLQHVHAVPSEACKVVNNCLDPFLSTRSEVTTAENLKSQYGFSDEHQVLLTLTRISSKERYKGYDRVMEAMVNLKIKYPQLKYILAGKYDANEKQHIDLLVKKYQLHNEVILPGFISDEALVAHFELADIYVMPSMKEGFGIVFIEAMYYGLPVIAGNMDGSVDALLQGALGTLVNPQDTNEIERAIESVLANKKDNLPNQYLLSENFGFDAYKRRLEEVLSL